jgi:hypothetical protein
MSATIFWPVYKNLALSSTRKINHKGTEDTKDFTKKAQPGFLLRDILRVFVPSWLNFLPRLGPAHTLGPSGGPTHTC